MTVRVKRGERGFSLLEVVIALALTMVVMTSLFVLLQRGQESFRREPEISQMNASVRSGLDQLSRDLEIAGLGTPPNVALLWSDGGGSAPDGVTVIYADPDVPIARPLPCGPGETPCGTVGTSAILSLDPLSFYPRPPDYDVVYLPGAVLYALQGPNGDPTCDAVAPGLVSFLVTDTAKCTGSSSSAGPAACDTVGLSVDPTRGATGVDVPPGFVNDVRLDCATVGFFHVVQYRVSPGLALERRDAASGDSWMTVAANIEDLQVQYTQGIGDAFEDRPALLPMGSDPGSWITRVRITVAGRTGGDDAAVYAADDTGLRRSFTTSISLRNQLSQAQDKAFALGLPGWN